MRGDAEGSEAAIISDGDADVCTADDQLQFKRINAAMSGVNPERFGEASGGKHHVAYDHGSAFFSDIDPGISYAEFRGFEDDCGCAGVVGFIGRDGGFGMGGAFKIDGGSRTFPGGIERGDDSSAIGETGDDLRSFGVGTDFKMRVVAGESDPL